MRAVSRIAFYGLVILIFAYLLFPILIVIPLSFSSGKYLTFPPPGFSLQWYANFFTRSAWTGFGVAQHLGRPCCHRALDAPGNAGGHWPRPRQVRGQEARERSHPVAGDRARHHCRDRPLFRLCELRARGAAAGSRPRPYRACRALRGDQCLLHTLWRRPPSRICGAKPWREPLGDVPAGHPAADPARHLRRRGLRLHHLFRRVARRACFCPERRRSPCRGGCGSRSASISIRRSLRSRRF